MNRIETCFQALRREGRIALIPYLTAGDPHPDHTVDLLHTLVDAGADIIEVGVPFSDPMADGPVIQRACERALAHHTSLARVLTMVAQFRTRNTHTPLVLMGYLNPVEAYGYAAFAERAAAVGVDGVLLVDLPPEEAENLLPLFQAHDLAPIFLVAPTSTPERQQRVSRVARGYIYYVSLKGVTGAAHLNSAELTAPLAAIRQWTDTPIAVGFGIKDAASAAAVAQVADGVVVGSALVELARDPARLADLLRSIRRALDNSRQAA